MNANEFEKVFEEVKAKIAERNSLYDSTWKEIPVNDLIAVARVKTYRASTMLIKNEFSKLIDDLIDAIAYLIFARILIENGKREVKTNEVSDLWV